MLFIFASIILEPAKCGISPLQKEGGGWWGGGQVFLREWSAWNGLPAPVTPRFRFDNVDYYFYLPPPNVEYWEPW